MHRLLPLVVLASLIAVLFPSLSWSQRSHDVAILVHGGYGSGNVFVDFDDDATINSACGCPVPEGRDATHALTGGFGVRLSTGTMGSFLERFGLVARLGFVETPVSWRAPLPDAFVLLPGTTTPVTQSVEDQLLFTMRDIGIETLVLFNPIADLDIGIGGSLAWRDLVGFRYSRELTSPANARFVTGQFPSENNGRRLVLGRKNDQDLNRVAAGAMASILYTIDFGGSVAIVPEVSYRVDLVKPINRSTWESTTVFALVSLRVRR